MPSRHLIAALLLTAVALLCVLGWIYLPHLTGPAPTQPEEPDEREASGADPEYGDELDALCRGEKELTTIAEELGIDLLDLDQRSMAEDILTLRLTVAETVDHFDQRVERLLAEWAPGWWEDAPTTVLPSFGAVHALITDTSEYRVVAA